MKNNLSQLIAKFQNDAEVRQFKQRRNQKTIFDMMDRLDNENAYSSFIAWLLDGNENPEASKFVATELIKLIEPQYQESRNRDRIILTKTEAHREHSIYTNNGRGRIDIFVQCETVNTDPSMATFPTKVNIAIENKIFSKLGDTQLQKYHNHVEREYRGDLNLYVLLAPQELDNKHKDYFFLSYQKLVLDILEPMLKLPDIPERVKVVTEDFILTLATYHNERKKKVIALNTTDKDLLLSICDNHQALIDELIEIHRKGEKIPFEYEDEKDQLCEILYMAAETRDFPSFSEDLSKYSQRRLHEANEISLSEMGKVLYIIEDDKPKRKGVKQYSMFEIAKEVMRRYIEAHPGITYEDLLEVCHKSHHPGCNNKLINNYKIEDRYRKIGKKLPMKGKNGDNYCQIYVSTQWTGPKTKQFQEFVKVYLNDDKFTINIRRIS